MNQSPNLNRSWEESQVIIKNLEAEISTQQAEINQLKEVKSCGCHVIDATKTSVLMWAEKNSPQFKAKCPGCACHAQNFVLKIAQQKMMGLIRTDKNKTIYWKYRNLWESEVKPKPNNPSPIKCLDCQAEMEIIGDASQALPLAWQKCLDCSAKKEVQKTEQKAQNISPDPQNQERKENHAQSN